jgi:endoglucanase
MKLSPLLLVFTANLAFAQQNLIINDQDYFEMPGLNIMVFSDFYPEGHQSGVTVIQHGNRVAANGDLRLEPSPGQWSPIPGKGKRTVSKETNTIVQQLWYPDSSRDRRGFNPIIYPDLKLNYQVKVTALERNSFKVTVDLEKPLPPEWIGKVGFNLELFPGDLFGKTYLMDNGGGIFPMQAEGPVVEYLGEYLTVPLATGKKLVVAPETDKQRIEIESMAGYLELLDGRSNHNNGWFIVRSSVPAGATKKAIEWIIKPNVIQGWNYGPVIHVSQVGYHPGQPKKAIIELDKSDNRQLKVEICRILGTGPAVVKSGQPEEWGAFLRYNYRTFDFTEIRESGMYIIKCGTASSEPFEISDDVYERDVWQPVLDYFLPVQMCHMRINDHYRVWHDWCHLDDALMAPVNHNHFDGYNQGPSTLTDFKPYEPVPGLNRGGWHDAGDYDLRVESQIGTVWILAMMIEEFGLNYDATSIDNEKRIVEIHIPDGKSDALQQIEHGLASVLGGYRSLGRLYRGIICQDLRQYVLEGDGSAMTDNMIYDASLKPGEVTAFKSGAVQEVHSGNKDDRLVFTEENPGRELYVAGGLAAASRVLKESNPELSAECLETALKLYDNATNIERQSAQNPAGQGSRGFSRLAGQKIIALSELILTTNKEDFKKELLSMQNDIVRDISRSGWAVARIIHLIENKPFKDQMTAAVAGYQSRLQEESLKSPFGVPFTPNIWGAGWNIQKFGVDQYFFSKSWPDLVSEESYINALNFILGVHPGENTASFASGIGSKSLTVAYGVNRAEWSYIPGGVASGTALIRPDLPELKIWPFFWQQTEYVMGGGSENFMFLVLAVNKFYKIRE